MKKLTFIILSLLLSVMMIQSFASYEASHWTLSQDGYYYYNQPITITDTSSSTMIDDRSITESTNTGYPYSAVQPIMHSFNHGEWQYQLEGSTPYMVKATAYLRVVAINNGNGTYTNKIYCGNYYDDRMFEVTGTLGTPIDLRLRYKADDLLEDTGQDLNAVWHHTLGDRVYVYGRYRYDIAGDSVDGNLPGNYGVGETDSANHYLTPVVAANSGIRPATYHAIKNPDPETFNTLTMVERKNNQETIIYQGASNQVVLKFQATLGMTLIGVNYVGSSMHEVSSQDPASLKIYWEHAEDQGTVDLNDWPTTTGNPYTNTAGERGFVDFTVNEDTHVVDLAMTYQGSIYNDQLTVEDISFLTDIVTANYYTDDSQQFIYITYDHADILRSDYSDLEGNQWRGFAIWNLTTNEISVIKKVIVKTYLVVDENHDAYAYFYTPNVIMDELLSVTISYRYRWLDYFGNYSAWEAPELVTLEADESSVSVTTWETKLLTTSMVLTGPTGLWLSLVSDDPPTWPLLLSGGLTTAVYLAFNQNITGYRHIDIDQIDNTPNLSASFIDEIETTLDVTIDQSANSPKKLYLGQYQQTMKQRVDFDAESFNYVELVWRTDGTVYILDDEQIITETPDFDYGGDDQDVGFDVWGWILSQIVLAYETSPQVFWIIGGVLLLISLPTIVMVVKGVKKGTKTLFTPLGIGIVLLIGLAVWILTG